MRGEKKKVREFELRKINSRTLHYLWYTLDITDGTARVAQGTDHESLFRIHKWAEFREISKLSFENLNCHFEGKSQKC